MAQEVGATTSTNVDFKWTDELLLTITHSYKVKKITKNEDWESVKTKYDNILAVMKAELPATTDEARDLIKDYPHTKEELAKKILSVKLKAVRGKFRNLVDLG